MTDQLATLPETVYRQIVEAIPIAEIMINRDGIILLVNALAERMFGYDRSELLGRPIEMLVPATIRAAHPGLRDSFFRDARPRYMGAGRDLSGVRKDGTGIPVEIGLTPIKTDRGEFVVAAIVDITERKRAEEKFRAVVESAPTAMVMIDQTGRISLVNTQVERLFGYRREELIGELIEVLVPARVRGRHPALRDGFFADPRPRFMGVGRDLFGVRKDGSEVPVEIGLNPLHTSEGRFVLAAIADITERVERERLMQKQRDEILALSTPVMQVWEKVLALPIIGTLDSYRAQRLTEGLLQAIAEQEADTVILDISGVPAIDTAVAQHLLRTIQAARLMGANTIISGVRPETAQAMVHLGIDLGTIRSRSTLREALQLALRSRKTLED